MEAVNENKTVRELAGKHPQCRQVFERFGVDSCCGGGRSLREAAADKGVPIEELLGVLERALKTPPQAVCERDWYQTPVSELAGHIERRHHTFTKQQVLRLGPVLAKVLEAHGPKHGDRLGRLQQVFEMFGIEIQEHMFKEEHILFPWIRRLEDFAQGKGPKPMSHCCRIDSPIRQMEYEHESTAKALHRMREVTADYAPPEDTCNTVADLYKSLEALEADLHEHIHLENNILFPRTVALDQVRAVR